jgi:sentrin-specific protease 7
MPASEQGSEQAKATDTAVRTSSPLLVFDSRPPTLVEEQDDEMLLNHREESELDLVNAHDTEPSPAAETARLKQLTLDESTPKGILPKVGSSPDSKRTKRKPPVKKWDSDQPTIIILDSLASGARSPAVRALKNYLLEEGREKRGMEAKIPQNAFYAKPSQIPTQANYYDCGIYLLGYMQQFFENPDEFKDRLLGGEMRTGDWPEMEIPNMRGLMRDILQGLYKHQESERKTSRTNKKAKPSESVPKATDATTKESLPAAKKEDVAVAAPLATKTATEPSPPESKIEPTDKKPPVAVSSSRLASPIKYSNPSPVMKQTDGYCSSPSRETQVMKVDNTPSPPGYAEKDQYAQQQKWLDRQDKAPAPSPLPTRRASPLVVIPSPEKRRLVDEQAKSSPSTVKARSPKKQRVVSPPKADVAKVASKKASSPAKLGSPLRTASPVSGSRGSSQNPISLDDTQETTVVAGLTPRTPRAQPIQTSSATVKIGTSSRKIRHRLENLFDGAADDTDSHVLETTEVSRAIANDDLSEIVSPSRMRQAVQQQYNDQPYNRAEDSAVPETPPAETRSPAAAGASLSQPISL